MPPPPVAAFTVRIYYEDTDLSGRVYHASYVRFLERGRTEWLRGMGFGHREIAKSFGVVFAVRRLQIEYLGPAEMDDLLRIDTQVVALRGASIEFCQSIFCGDKRLIDAKVLVASIRSGRPARISGVLRERFKEALDVKTGKRAASRSRSGDRAGAK